MNNKTEEPLLEKTPLWQRKEGQSPTGGLTPAASKEEGLGRPVTEEPSKLKKGGKAAKRRKSFCARMGGMRKRQKDSNNTGKDRLSLSLKKWNCSTDINKEGMPTMSERQIKLENARIELAERCWSGYEPTPGKKAYSKGSCQTKGSSKKKKKKVAEAREVLAEKVLEALSPDKTKADPNTRKKRMKIGAEAVKSRADKVVNKAAAPKEEEPQPTVKATRHSSEGPLGHSRSNTLDHTMAGHRTRSGKPVPNPRSTQSSTTAHGGTAGSEENKVNSATSDQINRSRSDNPGQVFTRGGNQKSKKPAAFGTSRRAVNRANQRSAKKNVSKYVDSMTKDLKHDDYT